MNLLRGGRAGLRGRQGVLNGRDQIGAELGA